MSETAPRRAFLTAQWRWLVMLNYEIAPRVLWPLVPAGTTLDLWQGRALVSVVGFRFLRTRVLGLPVPFHRDFDEVNLRFYVRHVTARGEVRRGVTFVRELVPRHAIAAVARAAYNEPYDAVRMRSTVPPGESDAPGRVAYEWQTRRRARIGSTVRDRLRAAVRARNIPRPWQCVAATAVGAPAVPPPDAEATFVTEHYWGYTRQRDGGTVEYEVSHPRWRVWDAEAPELRADVARLYGPAFFPALTAPPTSAFVAEGSPVTVYRPRRLGVARR